jgi:uncharacterized protein
VTGTPPPSKAAILDRTRRIAVVGASDRPSRPSYGVVGRLLALGYEIVPVNPHVRSVHGIPAVAHLRDVDGPVDLVDVFRRAEHAPAIAEDAVALGAGGLWLQQGVRSPAARDVARSGGLGYVEDACLAVEVIVGGHRPAEHRAGEGEL